MGRTLDFNIETRNINKAMMHYMQSTEYAYLVRHVCYLECNCYSELRETI